MCNNELDIFINFAIFTWPAWVSHFISLLYFEVLASGITIFLVFFNNFHSCFSLPLFAYYVLKSNDLFFRLVSQLQCLCGWNFLFRLKAFITLLNLRRWDTAIPGPTWPIGLTQRTFRWPSWLSQTVNCQVLFIETRRMHCVGAML